METMTVPASCVDILGHARTRLWDEEPAHMAMPMQTKRWTLEEVHSLPDDGNRYELIHGVLYVTPAPRDSHETIAARLTRILDPYVARHGLGYVFRPKAVIQVNEDVQVEPDLMVRQEHPDPDGDWKTAPLPILVIETLSSSTRRRDWGVKRDLYIDELHIPEYWIVDRWSRSISVIRANGHRADFADRFEWHPQGASEPLVVELREVFPH
jgi:Uma2 family endonuclease